MLDGVMNQGDEAQMRLVLDVRYALNGVSAEAMAEMLKAMCERAIGEGMLTGFTEATVEEHSMDVKQISSEAAKLDEDGLTRLMHERIENGDLLAEDVPNRLARYGLMDPVEFRNEMAERLEMAAEH